MPDVRHVQEGHPNAPTASSAHFSRILRLRCPVGPAGQRAEGRPHRRSMAGVSRRRGQYRVLPPRPDQPRHRAEAPGRLDLAVRQLRHRRADEHDRDDSADGQRRALLHRGPAAQRRRRRCRHRRDALDLAHRRGRAVRRGAAQGPPRRRLLGERQRPARRPGHARLPAGVVEREDRTAGARLRSERHRRSVQAARPRYEARSAGAHRQQLARGHRQRRDRRRSGADAGRTGQHRERQGRHHGLRCPHRQEAVDVPHDSAARRARLGNLAR